MFGSKLPRQYIAAFFIFSGVALIISLQIYWVRAFQDNPESFWRIFQWQLAAWYLWTLFTPLIIYLGRQFPLIDKRWLAASGIHFIAALLVSSVYLLMMNGLLFLFESASGNISFWDNYFAILMMQIHFNLAIYFLILFADRAIHYYRSAGKVFLKGEEIPDKNGKDDQQESYISRLLIKSANRSIIVKAEDIRWIAAADYYARVHTAEQAHLVRQSLNTLEQQLNPQQFIRIHRSTIINIDYLREMEPLYNGAYAVTMQDGTALRLSRNRREKLQSLLKAAL